MTVAPAVFTCGGNSGGGTGIPVTQELPNGWSFRLSTAQIVTADMTMTEEIGITPDYPVNNSPDDIANNRDAILEKAIKILNERTTIHN
jgi:C-terminal processing protease CtpA/Prc